MKSTVTVVDHNGQTKIVALWPASATGNELIIFRDIAEAAAGAVTRFYGERQRIAADQRLSDRGRIEDTQHAAVASLKPFEKYLAHLDSEAKKLAHDEEAFAGKALAPREKTDVTGTMIDLAVAQRLSEMDHAKLKMQIDVGGADRDLLRVAAIMPPVLTGVSQEHRDAARNALLAAVDPIGAAELAARHDAVRATAEALERSWGLIAENTPDRAARQGAAPTAFARFDPVRARTAPKPLSAQ